MNQLPVFPIPTLSEVQTRFSAWRRNKKDGRCIPEELWAAAVKLSPKHSIHKISRGLSLSHAELKKRVAADNVSQTDNNNSLQHFMTIDVPPTHPAECIVEMEHHNGNRVRMYFKGKADFDLQSFAESFWSRRP